jgi:hypothetical protein
MAQPLCSVGVAGRLAPASTREAPSRIAQTPLFFRGSELQLRQNTAARSAFLSRCSSRELSLSRLSKVPEPAPAFTREASSQDTETRALLAPLECGGLPPLCPLMPQESCRLNAAATYPASPMCVSSLPPSPAKPRRELRRPRRSSGGRSFSSDKNPRRAAPSFRGAVPASCLFRCSPKCRSSLPLSPAKSRRELRRPRRPA